jgi:hypothetical protein
MTTPSKFALGARVRVRTDNPKHHNRTPRFTRGKIGTIARQHGPMPLPEDLGYGRVGGESVPIYRVHFRQADLWPDYTGPDGDIVSADLHEHWLEPAP